MAKETTGNGRLGVLMWALGIMLAITAGINGWSVNQIVELRAQQSKMQGNRFTNKDGLKVWQAIGKIQTDVAVLQANGSKMQ